MTAFARYIGIDYSGAKTPTASLPGLRVYAATRHRPPVEVLPPPGPQKYWTRKGVAFGLVHTLSDDKPTLVGIDHGFSFPLRYFQTHHLPLDWPSFLDDFRSHWPTDADSTYVDFVRDGIIGNGAARMGSARWLRLTEQRTRSAKSVFQFDVKGQVAKSTHAGLPWLRFIRKHLGDRVHFWPFDGWQIPAGKSAIVEVYPRLWNRDFAPEDRTRDQHDAYCVTAALSRADRESRIVAFLNPELTSAERAIAQVEGWILGVSPSTDIREGLKEGVHSKSSHGAIARPTARDHKVDPNLKATSGSEGQWRSKARAQMHAILRSLARARETISFGRLAKRITAYRFMPNDRTFRELLCEISSVENAAGRGLLSVLVVQSGDKMPGPQGLAVLRPLD